MDAPPIPICAAQRVSVSESPVQHSSPWCALCPPPPHKTLQCCVQAAPTHTGDKCKGAPPRVGGGEGMHHSSIPQVPTPCSGPPQPPRPTELHQTPSAACSAARTPPEPQSKTHNWPIRRWAHTSGGRTPVAGDCHGEALAAKPVRVKKSAPTTEGQAAPLTWQAARTTHMQEGMPPAHARRRCGCGGSTARCSR